MSGAELALVSVVIPCYKQAHFLSEAIESVLEQTYPKVEIVVVDDGSPDDTADVVLRYPGVRCLRNVNSGVAGARNAGWQATNGEYLQFLDADDRLTTNSVAAHLACFAEHPESGFVVGDVDNISVDGTYLSSPRWPLYTENVYEKILSGNHVANSIAVLFRRAVIERTDGFKASCSCAADVELLLHAAYLFPSAHHRSTVACYRRYQDTMSRKGELMLPAIEQVMELQQDRVRGNRRLLKAYDDGKVFWADYFGKEMLKDILVHVAQRAPWQTVKSLAFLFRYVGYRPFVWPWKYRRRFGRITKFFKSQRELVRRVSPSQD